VGWRFEFKGWWDLRFEGNFKRKPAECEEFLKKIATPQISET
jgi:hypothetical protein